MVGVAHTRFTATGVIGGATLPYEIFSFGFAVAHDGDTLTLLQQSSISDAIAAMFVAPNTAIANNAHLRAVKAAHVNAAGVQDQPTTIFPHLVSGGTGGSNRPSQVALAVSLVGPAAVRPIKGRFYLPMPNMGISTDSGVMTEASASSVVDRVETLANAIKGLGPTVRLAIDHKGGLAVVNKIRVGRALDTIRTRRNQVLEGYVVGNAYAP